ncbi:MAG: toll/interleukin-1 receptor domain-containing protein [Propionibacteriaceae bacterium]|nr:toll/interleukin-1 receptor domain-containing protein [Propionibacteriaceae bacterium]
MKVFISWSGPLSKKVAQVLKDWIPSVIQAIEPFLSSEDIEKGNRWNTDIARELQESTFGIICVTLENLSAEWLNFEAGALSKTIENTHVAPFLLDVRPSDLG